MTDGRDEPVADRLFRARTTIAAIDRTLKEMDDTQRIQWDRIDLLRQYRRRLWNLLKELEDGLDSDADEAWR